MKHNERVQIAGLSREWVRVRTDLRNEGWVRAKYLRRAPVPAGPAPKGSSSQASRLRLGGLSLEAKQESKAAAGDREAAEQLILGPKLISPRCSVTSGEVKDGNGAADVIEL